VPPELQRLASRSESSASHPRPTPNNRANNGPRSSSAQSFGNDMYQPGRRTIPQWKRPPSNSSAGHGPAISGEMYSRASLHGSAPQQYPQPLQACPEGGFGGPRSWLTRLDMAHLMERKPGRRCKPRPEDRRKRAEDSDSFGAAKGREVRDGGSVLARLSGSQGAVMPLVRRLAVTVAVFQCAWGTLIRQRSPRGARP
jgi:hypothetical protein